jgi:hypothetical protein
MNSAGRYVTLRAGSASTRRLNGDQNQVACSFDLLQPKFRGLRQKRLQMAGEDSHLICQDKTFQAKYVLGTLKRSKTSIKIAEEAQ